MGRRIVIGVMGGGAADSDTAALAEELGRQIAQAGWVVLTGGRPAGVMRAASRGAARAGGLVIGVLPDASPDAADEHVTVAIATGMGDARNAINVLSSDAVVACPGGAGTLSEVALALKAGRPVVLLGFEPGPIGDLAEESGRLHRASDPEQVMGILDGLLG